MISRIFISYSLFFDLNLELKMKISRLNSNLYSTILFLCLLFSTNFLSSNLYGETLIVDEQDQLELTGQKLAKAIWEYVYTNTDKSIHTSKEVSAQYVLSSFMLAWLKSLNINTPSDEHEFIETLDSDEDQFYAEVYLASLHHFFFFI